MQMRSSGRPPSSNAAIARTTGSCASERPEEALVALESVHAAGGDVALVLAALACTELLGRLAQLYPRARRGLLIPWGGWGDDATAAAIREAMAYGLIDYYVLHPGSAPDEYFHRTISELLTDWQRSDPEVSREVTIVADPRLARSREVRNLLSRSGVPHAFHSTASEEGGRLLEGAGVEEPNGPVVILADGTVLHDPSATDLARGYRVPAELEKDEYELVIVGAGRAGLAAAVYASSEDLTRSSSSGRDRRAGRLELPDPELPRVFSRPERCRARAARVSAGLGLRNALPVDEGGPRASAGRRPPRARDRGRHGSPGAKRRARHGNLVPATRAPGCRAPDRTRRLLRDLATDAPQFTDKRVAVVGGGNSAGQAALHLRALPARVTLVVRGGSLAASMSKYLENEIEACENIDVRYSTEVVGAVGGERLEEIVLRDEDGSTEATPAEGLFVLIGAHPHTEWLPAEIARDEAGYVITDEHLGDAWPFERSPHVFETSAPGVFAVGDVRSRSVKRVAAAVGEGSVVVQQCHLYLESPDSDFRLSWRRGRARNEEKRDPPACGC